MLKRIQFSEGTARKYMAIAAHPVISNRSGWNALPPSWTTLYELTKLPHGIFQARIDDDTITPEFEGTAVASLKAELAGSRSSRRHDSQERIAELQRENDLLRSEVEALRAELEDREASQSNGAPAVAARVIELMTDEDRQLLEREGQRRLPFEAFAPNTGE